MVVQMVITRAFHENVHAYFYVSSNMWREIRSFVVARIFWDDF